MKYHGKTAKPILISISALGFLSVEPAFAGEPVPQRESAKTREALSQSVDLVDKAVGTALETGKMTAESMVRKEILSPESGRVRRAAEHFGNVRTLDKFSGAIGKATTGLGIAVGCSGIANGSDIGGGDCAQSLINTGASAVAEIAGQAAARGVVLLRNAPAVFGATASGAVGAASIAGSVVGDVVNENAWRVDAFGLQKGERVNDFLTRKVYIPVSEPAFKLYEEHLSRQACGFSDCTSGDAISAHARRLRERDQTAREDVFTSTSGDAGEIPANSVRADKPSNMSAASNQSNTAFASARARASTMKEQFSASQSQQPRTEDQSGGNSATGAPNTSLADVMSLINGVVADIGATHQSTTGSQKGKSVCRQAQQIDPATGCHPGHDEGAHPGGCKCG